MSSLTRVRPREYHDSVRLMRLSDALRQEPGVREAVVMMATPNNKKILATAGLMTKQAEAARPDDLVIALRADSAEQAEAAFQAGLDQLASRGAAAGAQAPRSLDAAVAAMPGANLVQISVPGAHAAREARRALELGLNVFLFSDNVPLDEEKHLKEMAGERGLLVMGPDCGTAIIGGVGLGFANVVRRGSVGVVGASGTGTQEITSLLDWLGVGVSHAIGTGGRDLKAAIGGATMCRALQMLAADAGTEVIVVTSKPPAPEVAEKVLALCETLGKPVIVNFLGQAPQAPRGQVQFAATLADTAQAAARAAGSDAALPAMPSGDRAAFLAQPLQPGQRFVRGLYAGGTLCAEAVSLLGPRLGQVHSNIAGPGLPDLETSVGHTVIDMGEDAYTDGRPHPMIDPALRNQRLLSEAADRQVALLLLDLVIGHGAHADPAGGLVVTLDRARALAARDGRALPVIVTICGTAQDPQDYAAQVATLTRAGVTVARTNAEAALLAAEFLTVHSPEATDVAQA